MTGLKTGVFYWVRYSLIEFAEDNRTLRTVDEISEPEPARFTGISGGSPPLPTWDFIGHASELGMREVRYIGPEISMPAFVHWVPI